MLGRKKWGRPAWLSKRDRGEDIQQRRRQDLRKLKRRVLTEQLEARRLLATDVSGTITADEVWSGTVHVTGDVTIADGVNVTVEPGTVVKINASRWITGVGSFDVNGTASEPVIFTSVNDDTVGEDLTPEATIGSPGDWESLYTYSGDWDVQHAEVRFAGGGGEGSIYVDDLQDPTDNNTDSSFANVSIVDSGNYGIESFRGTVDFSNIDVTGSTLSAFQQSAGADATYSQLSASGNLGGDHVRYAGRTVSSDQTWDFGGLPAHVVGDVNINGANTTLNVIPGSIIKLGSSAGIKASSAAGDRGSLIAVGTSGQPIIFTSVNDDSVGGDSNADGDAASPSPGDWDAFNLYNSDSRLEHVEVRYGGGDNNGGIGLSTDTFGTSPATTISNVALIDNQAEGIEVFAGNPSLNNISIVGSTNVAIEVGSGARPTFQNITASGNEDGDHVQLRSQVYDEDFTWDFGGLPVHVMSDINVNGASTTLTIVPGSVIKFNPATGIQGSAAVNDRGSLVAVGTSEQPIIFTSTKDDTFGGDSNADGDATT
ncbi:MAG: hypothetical protein AAGI63_06600, partial [Planctomycetota bacterium]